MKKEKFLFSATVWLYPSETAAWHFVTVPKKISTSITERFGKAKRGWGSLPVDVNIGETKWKTSIFPDSKTGTYILPLKAHVRRSEGIFEGDLVAISITLCP